MIPWEGTVVKGRESTIGYGCLAFLATSLWIARQITRSRKRGGDDRKLLLLFNTAAKLVTNLTSFVMQTILLTALFTDIEDERVCPYMVDLYIIPLILIANTYFLELFSRPDADALMFGHHMISILLFVFLLTRNGDGESFSPIIRQEGWRQLMALGTVIGMFASTEFPVNVGIFCYHMAKDSQPLFVYRALCTALFLQVTSRIAMHVLFHFVFALVFPEVQSRSKTLLILVLIFALALMIIEYMHPYILLKIIRSHRRKRLTGLPKSSSNQIKDEADRRAVETDHSKMSGKAPENDNDSNM